MMIRFFVFIFFIAHSLCFAGFSLVNGKWAREEFVPTLSVQEHYDSGYQLLYKNEWDDALRNFMIIVYNFEESPFFADSLFYSAVCCYFKGDFEDALRSFDKYLDVGGKLKYFEKTFDFKYHIAEYYRTGWKKHVFGKKNIPVLVSATNDALTIYDEIIVALGGHELAAQALFGKAQLLKARRNYKESIESLKILTHRFPKHSLAADGYLKISEIYLEQMEIESQNPDFVALAQLNLTRFVKSFPSDERARQAETNIISMKEIYARSLYETGKLYERKKKPKASMIYYHDASIRYPETDSGQKSHKRLTELDPNWNPERKVNQAVA